MNRFEIPYVGSFQRGNIYRTGDAINSVWRHIERIGTIDSLARIAELREHDTSMTRSASLRIRQAVELRKASRGATTLTRPLLLYYAALNLVRGFLLTQLGDLGHPAHGLRYKSGNSPLECAAELTKNGTFGQITKLFGFDLETLDGKKITLRDALAAVAELTGDFHLLNAGSSSIAFVAVEAVMNGKMSLRYYIQNITEDIFSERWPEFLPWLKDECEYVGPFTLQLKSDPQNESEIEKFCRERLLHDLNWRENAVWFDHVARNGAILLPRISAYLSALFILSNMSRYEPELLDDATRDPTDLAYVLSTFLDHVERYFPQLILEALHGTGMFFK